MRGGKLNVSGWSERMRGSGVLADQTAQLFRVCLRRSGLDRVVPEYDCTQFRRPQPARGQLRLF
jgi:hypothetical protein